MTGAASAINCTSCGAGLGVLGGGRVEAHVCSYCGSVLDAQHDYAVLATYANMPRPDTPLRLGMRGRFEGVEFTIIGILGKTERYGVETWAWVEHQLYSPTHGYAWLVREDSGHFTFSRRLRAQADHWLTPAEVERAEHRPIRSVGGHLYRYYSSGAGETTFIEGEFTWTPKLGEVTPEVEMVREDAIVTLSQSETEREIWLGTWVPAETIAETFGLDAVPSVRGLHPAQPFVPNRNRQFAKRWTLWGGLVALVVALAFAGISGRQVHEAVFQPGQLPHVAEFTLTETTQVAQLRLNANQQNSWGSYAIELTGPGPGATPETLVDTERAISFYSGRDSDGTWTEGSQTATLRFRPEAAGQHRLTVAGGERGGNATTIRVAVFEGAPTAFWLWIAAGALLATSIVLRFERGAFNRRKMAGSDWDDEE